MKFASTGAAPQNARLPEVDRLRAVACLAVVAWHVLVHVADRAPASQQAGWYAASQLFVWGGPVFFFLSAFLCFRQHPEGSRAPGYWGRRLLLVGVPYLVWSCVYLLLELRNVQGQAPADVLLSTGAVLLFGVKHLAFVNALLQFYLLFPILRWLTNRANPAVLALSGFLIGVAWLEGASRFLPPAPAPAYSSHAAFLPAWLPYVVLGAWAARHPEQLRRLAPRPTGLWAASALLVCGSLGMLFGRTAAGTPIYAGAARLDVLLMALLWLPFLLRYAARSGAGVIASLSREFALYTPAVFFAHLLPLGLAATLVPVSWGPWALLALYLVTTTVGTGLLIRAFNRSPGAMLVVGMLDRPRRPFTLMTVAEDEEAPALRAAG